MFAAGSGVFVQMKPFRTLSLCAAGAVALAGTAHAGGFVAPVEPIIVAPVAEQAPSDWAGGYAGLSLGYSFGADDEIGFDYLQGGDDNMIGRRTALENVKVSGPTASLQAGYRWQRGNWVYGPELAIEGGNVDDSREFTAPGQGLGAGTDYELESKVNWIATLAFKTGYLMNPQTMIYGTAGVNHGDFDYTLTANGASETVGYTQNGWVLGLGFERKLTERTSMFAEYQYRQFDKTSIYYRDGADALRTEATPKHQNIRLGVNFSF